MRGRVDSCNHATSQPLTPDAIRALEQDEARRRGEDVERACERYRRILVELGVDGIDPRTIDGGGKK